jgi:hypothetical protein
MRTELFGIFGPSTPYRHVDADEVRRHPAKVVGIATASHRDSVRGFRVFTGRIDFADDYHADFRFLTEGERDAFAAEFEARKVESAW